MQIFHRNVEGCGGTCGVAVAVAQEELKTPKEAPEPRGSSLMSSLFLVSSISYVGTRPIQSFSESGEDRRWDERTTSPRPSPSNQPRPAHDQPRKNPPAVSTQERSYLLYPSAYWPAAALEPGPVHCFV